MENTTNNQIQDHQVEDNIIDDDFFFGEEEIKTEKIKKLKEPKVMPSSKKENIDAAMKEVDYNQLENADIEMQTSFYLATEAEDFIQDDEVGYRDHKEIKHLTNDVKHEETELNLKPITISKRAKTVKAALVKMKQSTGIGNVIHVPLWHSGFWITLEPLNNVEIINLELDILNNLTKLGKETNNLIFSNHSVIFVDTIFRHIKSKIINTSIKLDDEDDLYDFIKVQDIHTIALAIAQSMYPNGFNAIIPCKNAVELDENNVPKCSYKAHINMDLGKLLFVDMSKLTEKHKSHMKNKTPKSMTKESVLEYQKTLPNSGEEDFTFKTMDGEISIVLETPSVKRYLESGTMFINKLKDEIVEIVKETNNDEEKVKNDFLAGMYLHFYLHYIKEIPYEDVKITDLEDITEALKIINSELSISEQVMATIKNYIDNSLVAIIGIPNYVCPVCKTPQVEHELIPLAVYEYFFTLLLSKYKRALEALEKQNKKG